MFLHCAPQHLTSAVGSLSPCPPLQKQHDINIAIAIQESGEWACPPSSSKLHSLHENGAVALPRIHRVGRVGLQKCQPIFRIQTKPSLATLIKISLRLLDRLLKRCDTPLSTIESRFVIIIPRALGVFDPAFWPVTVCQFASGYQGARSEGIPS